MRMAAMGLPVPQGFCPCNRTGAESTQQGDEVEAHLPSVLQSGIRNLEQVTGLVFGQRAAPPAWFRFRSGAPISMPGHDGYRPQRRTQMIRSLTGLLRLTGDHRLVWDSYRRSDSVLCRDRVPAYRPRLFEAALGTTLREKRS